MRTPPQTLDSLHETASRSRDLAPAAAWLVAVALPDTPAVGRRSFEEARDAFDEARDLARDLAEMRLGRCFLDRSGDFQNPYRGLRRWTFGPGRTKQAEEVGQGEVAIYDDGSVAAAFRISGEVPGNNMPLDPLAIRADSFEYSACALLALAYTIAPANSQEYDVRLGMQWDGTEPLTVLYQGNYVSQHAVSRPLRHPELVEATVSVRVPGDERGTQADELALDCVNQLGVRDLSVRRDF